ncbi:hypothetical protein DERF_005745 [Dermatophagoides farinae]|uniref:Uncharacterized protein n=1 Tax=Dermatophagoides farinae TaxID=6954 RepID=A0A922L6H6_DERFA|nr:hypothetical protein DERF_005745 [Dermatophagoides farinae]
MKPTHSTNDRDDLIIMIIIITRMIVSRATWSSAFLYEIEEKRFNCQKKDLRQSDRVPTLNVNE